MEPIKATRKSVSYHEAAHAVITLSLPIREHIGCVWIQEKDSVWSGGSTSNASNWIEGTEDQRKVWRHAISIAGPIYDLEHFPEILNAELSSYFKKDKRLIESAREMFKIMGSNKFFKCIASWSSTDFNEFSDFLSELTNVPEGFEIIEESVREHLNDPLIAENIKTISARLIESKGISRRDLLKLPSKDLILPPDCSLKKRRHTLDPFKN